MSDAFDCDAPASDTSERRRAFAASVEGSGATRWPLGSAPAGIRAVHLDSDSGDSNRYCSEPCSSCWFSSRIVTGRSGTVAWAGAPARSVVSDSGSDRLTDSRSGDASLSTSGDPVPPGGVSASPVSDDASASWPSDSTPAVSDRAWVSDADVRSPFDSTSPGRSLLFLRSSVAKSALLFCDCAVSNDDVCRFESSMTASWAGSETGLIGSREGRGRGAAQ